MKNLENILNKDEFSREEIIYLISLKSNVEKNLIRERAKNYLIKEFSNEIHTRALVNFSNYCEENCTFCDLREDNFTVKRYRLEADEIIEIAKKISNLGFKTIFLQSGEDSYYDPDIIAYIIYSIKQQTDLALTLNIGPKNFDDYRSWKLAGADRYFLKFYTSNSALYSINHNKKNLFDKISHLKFLKRIGFQIGTGSIIGLPHQTIEDIADDLLLCKELDADMVSFSPFIPHPFTPYQNQKYADIDIVLNTIAVARLMLKNVHIHATSTLDLLDKAGRFKALQSGANVVVIDLSSLSKIKHLSEISPIEKSFDYLNNLSMFVEESGYKISSTVGNSLKMSVSKVI